MYHILVVEDDAAISGLIEMNLQIAGYSCTVTEDGLMALACIQKEHYDLAVLDIMLPKLDGYELLPYMKKAEIPVVYVSALGQEMDRVKGLRLGAEDYLVKPFSVLELLVRIEKILERHGAKYQNLELYGVKVLQSERTVYVNGSKVELKPMEYALMLMFMKHPNIVFTREQLLHEVWGDEYFGETRTVDNHVAVLRKKLNWSERIVTVHRVGYKLEVE